MKSLCVCLFVKPPELGKVKTRLSATIGDAAALAAYIELVEYQLPAIARLAQQGASLQMWFAETPNVLASQWAEQIGASTYVQQGESLGVRMLGAFEANRSFEKVIVVGSDCPLMDDLVLNEAARRLSESDVVFNPAEDGGYVLVGAKAAHAGLFHDIEWSTTRVLAQSIQAAQQLGLEVALGPTMWDVDEHEDLQRWRSLLRSSPEV